jgi:hypothetical protein
MKQSLLMVFALAAIGGVNQAKADVTLFMTIPGSAPPWYQYGNDGFTFTPKVDITVTALDYYVSDSTLSYEHGVGIYAASPTPGAPLVQAIVGACNPCTLVGGEGGTSFFASVAITPIVLTAGTQYMLAGYSDPGESENGGNPAGSGIALADLGIPSPITFGGYYYDYSGSLDYPTSPYGTAFVGPNFEFSTPDGGTTVALLGLAVVGLAGLRRKLSL